METLLTIIGFIVFGIIISIVSTKRKYKRSQSR